MPDLTLTIVIKTPGLPADDKAADAMGEQVERHMEELPWVVEAAVVDYEEGA
jgi:hypothetical protein